MSSFSLTVKIARQMVEMISLLDDLQLNLTAIATCKRIEI